MVCHINGVEVTLTEGLSLQEYLIQQNLVPERVVVEHNKKLVARGSFKDTRLGDGDRVEILSFVGGG